MAEKKLEGGFSLGDRVIANFNKGGGKRVADSAYIDSMVTALVVGETADALYNHARHSAWQGDAAQYRGVRLLIKSERSGRTYAIIPGNIYRTPTKEEVKEAMDKFKDGDVVEVVTGPSWGDAPDVKVGDVGKITGKTARSFWNGQSGRSVRGPQGDVPFFGQRYLVEMPGGGVYAVFGGDLKASKKKVAKKKAAVKRKVAKKKSLKKATPEAGTDPNAPLTDVELDKKIEELGTLITKIVSVRIKLNDRRTEIEGMHDRLVKERDVRKKYKEFKAKNLEDGIEEVLDTVLELMKE